MERIKPKIGISIGDLNGIGMEVIIKTFEDIRILDYCTPIIYGSAKAVSYHRNVYKTDNFRYNIASTPEHTKEGIVNVVNCWEEQVDINLGVPNEKQGRYALKALEAVAQDMSKGLIDAIITAPVNKKHISLEKPGFKGQTEFFAEAFGVKDTVMMLVSDSLRVGLVTNHLPISEVAQNITEELILRKIKVMVEALRRDYLLDRPKIAVLALNPHAGDEGIIGTEDDEIIRPAVKKANEQFDGLIFGPYAADGFFGSNMFNQFDAILSMYHDQGLVPFKALSFGHGVNYTAGLPVVRTSPDHGTAYNIAGQFIANPDSFRKAVFMAIDIVNNRANYDDMTANPLKKQVLRRERG